SGVDPAVDFDSGGGHAGPSMSEDEFNEMRATALTEGDAAVGLTLAALGRDNAKPAVLEGAPGPAICDFAAGQGAAAIVIGTRGRGGLKRAFLGSVSDHVVRNAHCPVIVVSQ